MRADAAVHDALASLLEYPRNGLHQIVDEAAPRVAAASPAAGAALAPFIEYVRGQPQHELEEVFTRTFDNSAERALEVGWHTFGENYTRGTFMVRMRQRLREEGVEENGELPDHLSHVLPLLGRAEARWAGDLAHDTVIPAAVKIRDALVAQQNPWAGVLDAVLEVLALHARSPRPPVGASVPSSWPPAPPSPPASHPAPLNQTHPLDDLPGPCGPGADLDSVEPCHE